MLSRRESVIRTGFDGVALKPSKCDIRDAHGLVFDAVTIDYEGRQHLPDPEDIAELADEKIVRVTTPVRADGFDPIGDDSLYSKLPEKVGHVLVAGHPTYLSEEEKRRRIAPRLRAALDRFSGSWVGTESVERMALATGATQFELLSGSTLREVRSLRDAGFAGEIAVYAPTVLTDEEDEILDAVGSYVARRKPVAKLLPEDTPTDRTATGYAREVLLKASRDYALTGTPEAVSKKVEKLRESGVDYVVGYPARGIDEFIF
ncbi:MAG: luciferase [Halobacteria archaeon]|nr:luciferase [Halobacteria archaeon]